MATTKQQPKFKDLFVCGTSIVSDRTGKLWVICADTGTVRPARFIFPADETASTK